MFEAIEAETQGTDDEISFRNFMSGQLLSAVTTLTGVRDGVAHGGFVSPSYFPAELKHHVTLAELQALTSNGFAAAAAGTETLLKHCPNCLSEYAEQNTIPLGVYATTQFHLMCNFNLQSMDQLQGRRVAEGSTMFSRWARELGMSRQALPPSEFQQALQRRTVDCVFAPKDWLVAFSIADSVKSIVNDTAHGVFPAAAMMTVNKDKWNALTDGQRKLLWTKQARALMSVVDGYYRDEARGEAAALESGATLIDLGAEYAETWRVFKDNERAAVIAAADGRGAENARAVVDMNISLIAEWEKIVADANDDVDAIATALFDRAYGEEPLR
ncbi:MAG: TRAP transporter substrate-binding protein DctP [Pseudomonadota bacterium]